MFYNRRTATTCRTMCSMIIKPTQVLQVCQQQQNQYFSSSHNDDTVNDAADDNTAPTRGPVWRVNGPMAEHWGESEGGTVRPCLQFNRRVRRHVQKQHQSILAGDSRPIEGRIRPAGIQRNHALRGSPRICRWSSNARYCIIHALSLSIIVIQYIHPIFSRALICFYTALRMWIDWLHILHI